MTTPAASPKNAWPLRIHTAARALKDWLIEPKSAGEDKRRREYILNIILIGSIAMLLLLDAVVLYYKLELGPNDHGISFLTFSIIPVFFVLLLALSRRGLFISASYLLIAAYFLSDSYAVWRWTADLPAALLGYALIIMLASILINTRFGFVTTSLIALFLIPLGYLQMRGIIPYDGSWKQNPSPTDTAVFAFIFFLIMTVAWLSNREIEKSLVRARKSEHELKDQRDLLEVKVKERTRDLEKAQFEKIEQVNQFAEFGQLASGLFHDMLNIMNTLSVKIDVNTMIGPAKESTAQPTPENASATTKQIEQFMHAIRKQLNRQASEEYFSINESIDQVVQLLAYKAHRENVGIIVEEETMLTGRYFGNPFQFHQIIFNLILNGIESYEHAPQQQERKRNVVIRTTQSNQVITLSVKDNGCGVDEKNQGKIFNPFFSTKPEPTGMGIGLASVKKAVEENLGGTITLHSTAGIGSEFIVIFPLREA